MEATVKEAISLKGKWGIDHLHSNLDFSVKHLVISTVRGSFGEYEAKLENQSGKFEDSQFHFSIDVQSISTGNDQRDGHLRTNDFFNAEEFPQITFESENIKATGEGEYDVTGNLTIRDITRKETFKVELGGMAKDGYGNSKLGLSATTKINRFDYDLKWNQLTEAGGVTVGKDVRISADLQFAKQ